MEMALATLAVVNAGIPILLNGIMIRLVTVHALKAISTALSKIFFFRKLIFGYSIKKINVQAKAIIK